jgi:hypothetical protein
MKTSDIVLHQTPWLSLMDVPSVGSKANPTKKSKEFWDNIYTKSRAGVYQISTTCPKDLIDGDIGYVGESSDIPTRVYGLRLSATSEQSDQHGCGRYIRSEGINPESVYFRILFTTPENRRVLETYLQQQMLDKFGYEQGFAWAAATSGVASSKFKAQDAIRRLNIEETKEVVEFIKIHLKNMYEQEYQNTLQEIFK